MEKQPRPDALDRALTDLYSIPIPAGYRAAWREAVLGEEQRRMKQPHPRTRFWRVALPAAAALVLVIGAITAGNLIPTVVPDSLSLPQQQPTTARMYAAESMPQSSEGSYDGSTAESRMADSLAFVPSGDVTLAMAPTGGTSNADTAAPAVPSAAKIVRTADLTVSTTSFDAGVQAVTALAQQAGGYIASVNVSGEASERQDRVAYYGLRVPSEKLDSFLTGLAGLGRVTSRYETATDMTTQYADTQLRLKTQQEKMSRLQALLSQAADVSALLEVENEIANTQYELDSLESSLRTIDRDVNLSNVSLTLMEQSDSQTASAVELTLGQRIASGFAASLRAMGAFLQNAVVFLAMALPVLVPLAVLALALWLLARARRRKAAKVGDPLTPGSSDPTTPPDPQP